MKWKERVKKSFHRQYKPFSVKTRSKLCKIQSNPQVLKALESSVSKNQVSLMDMKGKKSFNRHYRTVLASTRSKLCKILSLKGVLKAFE